MVGNERHWGMGTIVRGTELLKQVYMSRRLWLLQLGILGTQYIMESSQSVHWSVSESNCSLVSSYHKYFLRYQVQARRTRPLHVPQLTLPSLNQIRCKILGLLHHFLK